MCPVGAVTTFDVTLIQLQPRLVNLAKIMKVELCGKYKLLINQGFVRMGLGTTLIRQPVGPVLNC